MSEVIVSVIIPVYNSERYIEKCITSIINQTYKNIELILVNDGSTDNSLKILEKYKKIDARVKVINRENRGSVYSRLEGLYIAKGKYIMFIDSDDWLDDIAIEESLQTLIKYDADMLKFNMVKEFVNEKRIKKINGIYNKEMYIEKKQFKKQLYPFLINSYLLNSMCAQLIKKDAFNLEIDSRSYDIKMGDDVMCNIQILNQIESFVFYPKFFYHYRTTENSITTTVSLEKIKKNIEDTFRVYNSFNEYKTMWDIIDKNGEENISKKVLKEVIASLNPLFINNFTIKQREKLIVYARQIIGINYTYDKKNLILREKLFIDKKYRQFIIYQLISIGLINRLKSYIKKILLNN